MKLVALALVGMVSTASASLAEQWREPQYSGYRLDRGQPIQNWRHHALIKKYRQLGLREPGPGQEWIRIENHFVLVSSATGTVRDLVAAR